MPGPAQGAGRTTARAVEMALLVRAAEGSGLTLAEFARRRGIEPGTPSWWRYELRRRALGSPDRRRPRAREDVPMQFVEIEAEDTASIASAAIELTVGRDYVVRVPAGFDETTLRRLLGVLGRAC